MTEKRPGPAPGVRLIEVSVKKELTVLTSLSLSLRAGSLIWVPRTGEARKIFQ